MADVSSYPAKSNPRDTVVVMKQYIKISKISLGLVGQFTGRNDK